MWLLLAACDRGAHGAPDAAASVLPSLSQSALAPVVAASASSLPPAAARDSEFAALVRAERWADARLALEALPAASRAQAEVRFVRARVALELDDAPAALTLLEGLHTAVPQLAPQIAEARARAQLRVGPFAEAAQYFEQRGDTESLLSAATAYERDLALPKARMALDRVLARLGKSKRTRSAEVRARAQRATLATQVGDRGTALADYRWLALAAPLRPESDLALKVLDGNAATRLSKSEHLDRASKLSEAGRVDATEAELALLAKAPGSPAPIGRMTYLRAFALYAARSNYSKAAELFERSAREAPDNAPRALFFAARALSRAQLDERAIAGYERVARQFPKTDWAEQAQYLSARLRFIAGDYLKARGLYDKYLAAFGKRARFGNDASYERGLCALETDQPLSAAPAFARLATLAKDRKNRARLRYLEALSLALGNHKEKATEAFTEVARSEPLSFFGLAARGRLGIVGAPQPPLIAEGAASAPYTPLALTLPADVAALNRVGLARDAERELMHQEASVSRAYAPRSTEALCQAYGALGVAERRYRVAQSAVRGTILDFAPTVANTWAWDCFYPRPYESLVQAAAQRENLSPSLLFAIMRQESAFDPGAGSTAGACGLLQLIVPTARRVADKLNEPFVESSLMCPNDNVRYGASYLAQLSGYFDGNLALVAAAYNAGPEAVFRWLSAPEKIGMDAFVARIPFEETRTYVERVLGNLARYQYLSGGAPAVSALNLALPRAGTRPDDVF
ncbi:MAG TPA: transglycosylase SLT domain-containing protein [Polyangiaceae bacterium]|nr:transglycosylase SLT domain-containing protein [Polyangiaceae bacterium]